MGAPSEICLRVLKCREELGLSQKEFAEKLGYKSGHLNNIEKGRTQPPRYFIQALLNIFPISYDYLKEGRGRPLLSTKRKIKNIEGGIRQYESECLEKFRRLSPKAQKIIMGTIDEFLETHEEPEEERKKA